MQTIKKNIMQQNLRVPLQCKERDLSIDTVRGVAILTMVAANLAPSLLAKPYPFWFRLYGTFAASIFVCIAGMMVVLTTQRNSYTLRHFLIRGGLIILMGALVDIWVWSILPFQSFDVLYLIGLSIPITYLVQKGANITRWTVILSIFTLTPILQNAFGYIAYPVTLSIYEGSRFFENIASYLKQLLIDGWFPVFPWLGFSLLGAEIAKIRWGKGGTQSFYSVPVLLISTGTLVTGTIIWAIFPSANYIRAGYGELFYPPSIGYCLSAVGVILSLLFVVDINPKLIILDPLRALGETSLLVYILHQVIGNYLSSHFWKESKMGKYILIYISIACLLILLCYGVRLYKHKKKKMWFISKFILGG
jgi:uncharacterized membrane protein